MIYVCYVTICYDEFSQPYEINMKFFFILTDFSFVTKFNYSK